MPDGVPHHPLRPLRLIISPRTVLRWHADLVRRRWACPRSAPGRPRTAPAVGALVLEMARHSPGWGSRRVHGELARLAHKLTPSTVWQMLKGAGIDPALKRTGQIWRAFLEARAKTIVAADFFHAGAVFPALVVRAVLHRARHLARAPGRDHRSPHAGVGNPAGPQPADGPRGAGNGFMFLIRPRRQVHCRLRRGLRRSRGADHQDAQSGRRVQTLSPRDGSPAPAPDQAAAPFPMPGHCPVRGPPRAAR